MPRPANRPPPKSLALRSAAADPYSRLETLIGLQHPSAEFRDRLHAIVDAYCPPSILDLPGQAVDHLIDLKNPVSPADSNRWLGQIEEQAQRLRDLLVVECPDPKDEWARSRTLDRLLPYPEQIAWQRDLAHLSAAARQMQRPSPKGRHANEWLRAVVWELVALHRDTTGRAPRRNNKGGKPQGQLFAFVKAFLGSFAKPTPNDAAIDEAIRHAISPRKR